MAGARNIISALIFRIAPRLRFPQLFTLTLGVFLLDLVIPDLIPFVDEIILGLATLLLGSWKTRKDEQQAKQDAQPDHEDDIIVEATVVDDEKRSGNSSKA
jgi:hypothetical protein